MNVSVDYVKNDHIRKTATPLMCVLFFLIFIFRLRDGVCPTNIYNRYKTIERIFKANV